MKDTRKTFLNVVRKTTAKKNQKGTPQLTSLVDIMEWILYPIFLSRKDPTFSGGGGDVYVKDRLDAVDQKQDKTTLEDTLEPEPQTHEEEAEDGLFSGISNEELPNDEL
ncbi:hypothetical protein QVD17_11169 [Tagetes erecta]|uniref:Uncharacterized protein n=1 Tax=Tagetes erecta TaxID=13708 RepID=A0AAD8L2I5_TARER|nr:hypothetical protein QVD17_11169 [Tagetes erecta]